MATDPSGTKGDCDDEANLMNGLRLILYTLLLSATVWAQGYRLGQIS